MNNEITKYMNEKHEMILGSMLRKEDFEEKLKELEKIPAKSPRRSLVVRDLIDMFSLIGIKCEPKMDNSYYRQLADSAELPDDSDVVDQIINVMYKNFEEYPRPEDYMKRIVDRCCEPADGWNDDTLRLRILKQYIKYGNYSPYKKTGNKTVAIYGGKTFIKNYVKDKLTIKSQTEKITKRRLTSPGTDDVLEELDDNIFELAFSELENDLKEINDTQDKENKELEKKHSEEQSRLNENFKAKYAERENYYLSELKETGDQYLKKSKELENICKDEYKELNKKYLEEKNKYENTEEYIALEKKFNKALKLYNTIAPDKDGEKDFSDKEQYKTERKKWERWNERRLNNEVTNSAEINTMIQSSKMKLAIIDELEKTESKLNTLKSEADKISEKMNELLNNYEKEKDKLLEKETKAQKAIIDKRKSEKKKLNETQTKESKKLKSKHSKENEALRSRYNDKRDDAKYKYSLLTLCDELSKGIFKNFKTKRALYYFAMIFNMTYAPESDPSFSEDDRKKDVEKNLFTDYYNNNVMRFIKSDEDFMDNKKYELDSSGYGINYKNYAEMVYVYYIARKDYTPVEKMEKADEMIKRLEAAYSENQEPDANIPQKNLTYYYESDFKKDEAYKMTEENFENYIAKKYKCGNGRQNSNFLSVMAERNTAAEILGELTAKIDIASCGQGMWFTESDRNDEKSTDNIKSRIKNSDSEKLDRFINVIYSIEHYLTNTETLFKPENASRTLIETAYYYNYLMNASDREISSRSFLDIYNDFTDLDTGLDHYLDQASYQPLNVKNIFDIALIFGAYCYINFNNKKIQEFRMSKILHSFTQEIGVSNRTPDKSSAKSK